jgi:hypothetical protein
VGPLRDALERTAREGRERVTDALSNRRRTDALAELGEIVLDLIRRGEIDVGELPEVRDIVAHLDEVDAGAGHHHADDADHDIAPPPVRQRFDSRRDDGTVSSKTWASAPKKSTAKVWRPPVDDEEATPAPIPTRHRPVPLPKDPHRKGGISFDDDEDLSEYMHPDDVPPKGSSSDD